MQGLELPFPVSLLPALTGLSVVVGLALLRTDPDSAPRVRAWFAIVGPVSLATTCLSFVAAAIGSANGLPLQAPMILGAETSLLGLVAILLRQRTHSP